MNQYVKSLWLAETVRLIEKDAGQFADDDANRQARAAGGSFSHRVIKRAEIISQQHGLLQAQQDWLSATKISIIILVIIAMCIGAGLAFSALAQNPVNLYWAVVNLLGLHLVTLILWLLSSIFIPNESGSFFIYFWLWLSKKLSRRKTVSYLLPAFMTLFGVKIRWFIGFIVNLLWSIILFSSLIVLIALLSTKHYSFEWQSTLLSADGVIAMTHNLGVIPSLFGFALPDASMIRLSEHALPNADVRSAWAMWLLGIFIIYGLSIRFFLMIFCGSKWLITCQKIAINTNYPEYQLLAEKLELSVVKSITDDDLNRSYSVPHSVTRVSGEYNILIAIEIEEHWQPPENVLFWGFINSIEQRKNILDRLQHQTINKLLIAVDTDRTPDRGIINLIKLLTTKSAQSQIWFIRQGRQLANWQTSIKQLNIKESEPTWLIKGDNSIE